MNILTHFVVIDDDAANNKICTVTLSKLTDNPHIQTFLDPIAGFNYIASEYESADHDHSCVLFLDINMPVMNGWEFLDRFDKLGDRVKNRVKIFILSSSVDKNDIDMANKNKYVAHYLIKPLTKETIRLVTYAQNRQFNKHA